MLIYTSSRLYVPINTSIRSMILVFIESAHTIDTADHPRILDIYA